MQKIQLDARSKIVRYAYLLGGDCKPFPGRPWRTSLCAIFWLCVATTFVLLAAAAVVAGALAYACLHPLATAEGLALAATVIGLTTLIVVGCDGLRTWRRIKRATRPPKRVGTSLGTLVIRGYRGFKGKYCPLVEIQ